MRNIFNIIVAAAAVVAFYFLSSRDRSSRGIQGFNSTEALNIFKSICNTSSGTEINNLAPNVSLRYYQQLELYVPASCVKKFKQAEKQKSRRPSEYNDFESMVNQFGDQNCHQDLQRLYDYRLTDHPSNSRSRAAQGQITSQITNKVLTQYFSLYRTEFVVEMRQLSNEDQSYLQSHPDITRRLEARIQDYIIGYFSKEQNSGSCEQINTQIITRIYEHYVKQRKFPTRIQKISTLGHPEGKNMSHNNRAQAMAYYDHAYLLLDSNIPDGEYTREEISAYTRNHSHSLKGYACDLWDYQPDLSPLHQYINSNKSPTRWLRTNIVSIFELSDFQISPGITNLLMKFDLNLDQTHFKKFT